MLEQKLLLSGQVTAVLRIKSFLTKGTGQGSSLLFFSLCMGISKEIEVTTISIDEGMMLKIKATNIALQYQSSLTPLVAQWRQRILSKSALHL